MKQLKPISSEEEASVRKLTDVVVERHGAGPVDPQLTFRTWEREGSLIIDPSVWREVLESAKVENLFATTFVFRAFEGQAPLQLQQFIDATRREQSAAMFPRHLVPLFGHLLADAGSDQEHTRLIIVRYTPTSFLRLIRPDTGPPTLDKVSRMYRRELPAATQFIFLKQAF